MTDKQVTKGADAGTDAGSMPDQAGATLPMPTTDTGGKQPSDKDVEKAQGALTKTAQAVIDAEQDVKDSGKSKEQLALEKAQSAHSDALAAHAGVAGAANAQQPMTVAEAKVVAVVSPDLSAGDNLAQKFGNDPANPKLAPGVKVDPTNFVKLSRKTPDLPGDQLAVTAVPPEMVGDYERAGWNRA